MQMEPLYRQYRQEVYCYLLGLTHDPLLAEDITSETFLGALASLARFGGGSSIRTWLFSIARNKWYDHLRRKRPAVPLDELAAVYLDGPDLAEHAYQCQLAERLRHLLEEEPERARQVVGMRMEGYSYPEISVRLGISEGSARVIDHRTRKKLRDTLEKEGLLYE